MKRKIAGWLSVGVFCTFQQLCGLAMAQQIINEDGNYLNCCGQHVIAPLQGWQSPSPLPPSFNLAPFQVTDTSGLPQNNTSVNLYVAGQNGNFSGGRGSTSADETLLNEPALYTVSFYIYGSYGNAYDGSLVVYDPNNPAGCAVADVTTCAVIPDINSTGTTGYCQDYQIGQYVQCEFVNGVGPTPVRYETPLVTDLNGATLKFQAMTTGVRIANTIVQIPVWHLGTLDANGHWTAGTGPLPSGPADLVLTGQACSGRSCLTPANTYLTVHASYTFPPPPPPTCTEECGDDRARR